LKDAQAFYNVDVIAPPPAPAPAPIIITETKKETKMTIFQAHIEYNELSRQFDDELLTENNEIVLDDLFKRIEKLKKEYSDIDAS
jgi:ribosomal protein RSM22 (predicted rRNA methylase)